MSYIGFIGNIGGLAGLNISILPTNQNFFVYYLKFFGFTIFQP